MLVCTNARLCPHYAHTCPSTASQALDQLAAHAASQSEAEAEKKRKLQEKETAARRERAQKAKEITEPAKYDEAVAGASQEIVQEDEAMVEAIETFVETHPEVLPTLTLGTYLGTQPKPKPERPEPSDAPYPDLHVHLTGRASG